MKLSYNVPELVAATGLSRSAIYAHLKAGRLTCHKSGRRLIFPRDVVQSFLDKLPPAREAKP